MGGRGLFVHIRNTLKVRAFLKRIRRPFLTRQVILDVGSVLEQCTALRKWYKAAPKKAKIDAAISEIEAKKKKKIALIIHEDCKSMYDEFCAKDGPKASSEICTNAELSSYLNSPLQLPSKRNV